MIKIERTICGYFDWGNWEEVTINEVPKTIEELNNLEYPTIFELTVKIEINGEEFIKIVRIQNRGEHWDFENHEKNFKDFWRVYKKFK